MAQRKTAKIKEVKDLFKGEFKESKDINQPNRVETDKDTFSRVNVLGTVEDTYLNSDETYGSIQLTDSTATIRVKAFDEVTQDLEELEKGDLVKAIGKIRKDDEGRFILGEIINKVENPKYAELRELELEKKKEGEEKTQDKEDEEREVEQEEEETEEEEFVEEAGKID